ncbi:hypothetical protein E2C01_068826 [Portunus trituberculatus]|uniref:Uncharacterized protein n=1 Tax=Portunus trituberculatus TaxID=210409 RepID=A0A5B7HYX4_PORTR|nr:hypothetical protein [Portunus trituberculatus]
MYPAIDEVMSCVTFCRYNMGQNNLRQCGGFPRSCAVASLPLSSRGCDGALSFLGNRVERQATCVHWATQYCYA